jgi:AraC-like DNA-binding protein
MIPAVQPVSTIDAFLATPLGRYFVGDGYLVWCWGETLAGSCHWGRLDCPRLQELMRFLAWRATEAGLARGFDMVSDCSRLSAIDSDAYELVTARFPELMPNLDQMVRRFAFVHGGGFLGAVMAGIVPLTWAEARWSAFEDARAAFAWLEHASGGEACVEVAALLARATGVSAAVEQLRRHLRATLGATSLAEAAAVMGRSPRMLQRDLRAAGRGFREELQQARIDSARALLIDTDLKLEAVAARVGFTSASQLGRVFRQLTGELPSAFRARHRG